MAAADRQRLLVGMDVGGTKTVIVVARASGEILAETRLEDWARGDWEEDLRTLAHTGRRLLGQAGVANERPAALGLSVPGPLHIATGTVIDAPNLAGWADVPIVERLAEGFGVPVILENDANAAALAEWRFGAGQGTRHFVYLTMSTGIGAGLILDGRLHRGASDQAGEIGHVPVVPGGRRCNCGLQGCLEAYAGGAGLTAIMREDIARGEKTSLLDLAGGDPERLSPRVWVEAIRAGDPYALALRERFLDHLAQGIALLVPILEPECVALGTIVERNRELFIDDLIARVRALTWPSFHQVRIAPAVLGERLPAYAALCVASLAPRAGRDR